MPKLDPLALTDSQLDDENLRFQLKEELIDAFPSCRGEIDAFLRIVVASKHPQPPTDLPIEDAVLMNSPSHLSLEKQIYYAKLDFLFCALRSQCPKEADAFLHCSRSMSPGLRQLRSSEILDREPPAACRALWRKFDSCLIQKTEEFARLQEERA